MINTIPFASHNGLHQITRSPLITPIEIIALPELHTAINLIFALEFPVGDDMMQIMTPSALLIEYKFKF